MTFNSNLSDGTNPQMGAENRQPLPNPWQRGGSGAATGGSTGGTTGNGGTGPGLLNTPGMQSLLQQMSENPRLMSSMLSAPYTNNMLQALAADPDVATQLINQVGFCFWLLLFGVTSFTQNSDDSEVEGKLSNKHTPYMHYASLRPALALGSSIYFFYIESKAHTKHHKHRRS